MSINTDLPISVVGNGPSKSFWIPEDHANEPSIGCNLYEGCRWTAIYDKKIAGELNAKKRRIRRPVIAVGNFAEAVLMSPDALKHIVLFGIVRKRPLRIHNAGVGAILWALRAGYGPIDLYGFDSLYTRKRTTDSDKFWPRPETLTAAPPGWMKSWVNIFEAYPDLKLNLHLPEGQRMKSKEINKHFNLVFHPEAK